MRTRFVIAITVLAGATLSAQPPRPAASPSLLPVTRVVLYKSGVGYFEHLATVSGDQSLSVQFTADQLDDVLKSLSALDLGDGRIVGVSYDSPTPIGRRLQALTLPLGQNEPTLGVLSALRGTRVEVRGSAGAPLVGRLLNVERLPAVSGDPPQTRDEISVLTDTGEIATIILTPATRVRIAERTVREEVNRYLGLSTSTGDRVPRRVVIATAGAGTRQVLVGYVGEAAVWKSTYRLIFPSESAGPPVLQGWGVVDNVSAADWTNVDLSLVAGAPQAFRQPLSTPLFATRPAVAVPVPAGLVPLSHEGALVGGVARIAGALTDPSGAVLPGVRVSAMQGNRVVASAATNQYGNYEIGGLAAGTYDLRMELPGFQTVTFPNYMLSPGSAATQNAQMRVGALSETVSVAGSTPQRVGGNVGGIAGGVSGGVVGGLGAAPPPPPAPALVEQRAVSIPIAASGSDVGDLFEYKMRDRVTIARNQSALVPILQTKLKAERVSLWNPSMGARPRRAVWMTNTSDLTLDAGSLSVVDGGAFAGEGLVELTKPGERRLVSYAADLSVTVAASGRPQPARVTSLRIARGVLVREVDERRERTYTVRNNDRDSRIVIIEHPIDAGWKLAPEIEPEESTASVHRLRMRVASGQTSELVATETRRLSTNYAVGSLTPEVLVSITDTGDQRARLEALLAPVFAKNSERQQVLTRIAEKEQEMRAISEDQTRVRENLAALKGSAEERRLTERYAKQLDAQETRMDALKNEATALRERDSALAGELAQLIASLALD
jgi:hypothetical protein